jgi:hypothetical protein
MSDVVKVHCELPLAWKLKLERLAAERKKAPAEVMTEAIAYYLGETVNTNVPRLDHLDSEVTTLRQSLQELTQRLNYVQAIALSRTSGQPTPPPPPSDHEYWDVDDEPDEILQDFLDPADRDPH